MDVVLCRELLRRPRDGRTTCSRAAVRDGFCTMHANLRDRQAQAVAANVVNVAIAEGVQEVVYHEPPPPPRRRILKAQRPSQIKLSGKLFECQLCNEDKVPVECDMDLECGCKICRACFNKLSDTKCPYCRVDMKSTKIGHNDMHNLARKAEQFKVDMEEEAFQDWLRQEERDMMADPMEFFQRVMGVRLLARRNPNWIPSPELNSEEDTVCLVRMIDAICEGSVASDEEGDQNVHQQCHDLFPMYDCGYLHSLYSRACEVMAPEEEY
jgi:hypothetical protein